MINIFVKKPCLISQDGLKSIFGINAECLSLNKSTMQRVV